jgi:hypothetical protein
MNRLRPIGRQRHFVVPARKLPTGAGAPSACVGIVLRRLARRNYFRTLGLRALAELRQAQAAKRLSVTGSRRLSRMASTWAAVRGGAEAAAPSSTSHAATSAASSIFVPNERPSNTGVLVTSSLTPRWRSSFTSASVVVLEDQLSLAIGRDGQNARLAAKLTGWRIDIKSEEEKRKEVEAEFGAIEAASAEADAPVFDWARTFDAWAQARLDAADFPALVNYAEQGAVAREAVPTNDHYLPMLYILGLLQPG